MYAFVKLSALFLHVFSQFHFDTGCLVLSGLVDSFQKIHQELLFFSRYGILIILSICKGGDTAAVVKAACLKSRKSRVQTPLWHSSFKETKCFFHTHS